MKNTKEKFPGYPHYPQGEDITRQDTRTDGDVEKASRSNKVNQSEITPLPTDEFPSDNTPEIVKGTSADITAEDLVALGDQENDNDEGEDETVIPSLRMNDSLMGGDLDVPGSEDADDVEGRGTEDEENNFFSRGQD